MTKLILRRQQRKAQYYTEKLGSDFTLDMMLIPSGRFMMGTPEAEIQRLCKQYNADYFKRENPQHEVKISFFFMGKYPITQAQWKAIAERTDLKVNIDLDPDPSRFKEDPPQPALERGEKAKTRWDRPVDQVNWYEAVEFCQRLSRETKRDYRLPSEAEWEYACRAGTTTPFHFGETITGELANYNARNTYADEPPGEYRQQTTPVGYFKVANAFGLYDMHGNVWEWCEDDYHPNYEGAPIDGSAWLSNDDNTTKILRGGSWLHFPYVCRSAYRFNYYPRDDRYDDIGFRLVRSFPGTL